MTNLCDCSCFFKTASVFHENQLCLVKVELYDAVHHVQGAIPNTDDEQGIRIMYNDANCTYQTGITLVFEWSGKAI